jgi:hypothetical protein
MDFSIINEALRQAYTQVVFRDAQKSNRCILKRHPRNEKECHLLKKMALQENAICAESAIFIGMML